MSPPVRLAVVVLVLLQVYQCAVPQQKRAATENATRPTLVPSAQNEANSKGDQEKRPTTAQKHKNTATKTLENTHTQLVKTLKTTLAETTPSLKVPQVKRVMKKMTLQPTTSKSTAKKPTTLQPTRKPAAKKITPKKSVNEFPLNEIFYKGRETNEANKFFRENDRKGKPLELVYEQAREQDLNELEEVLKRRFLRTNLKS